METAKVMYEDVRRCINDGMSVAETAELCGVCEQTVRNYTTDIRPKRICSRMTEWQKASALEMRHAGYMSKAIAEKLNLKESTLSQFFKRYKEDDSENKIVVISTAKADDTSSIEVQTAISEPETKAVDSDVEIPRNQVEHKARRYSNFSANFDGIFGRYMIRNDRVRVMIDGECLDKSMNELECLASEILDVCERFREVCE